MGTFIVIVVVLVWIFVASSNSDDSSSGRLSQPSGSGSRLRAPTAHMGPFEIRVLQSRIDESDEESPTIKKIEGRGLFPVESIARVGIVVSVFDKTTGELEPVLSMIEAFQEEESIAFQHQSEIGQVNFMQGLARWARIGVVIPEILKPPYGGKRSLEIIVRMVDLDDPPVINLGFHQSHPGLLWQRSQSFTWNFEEKGYQEEAEDRDEAMALSIKVAVAVAMADGELADSEGKVIQSGIRKAISPFQGDRRQELKELYNGALKEAYSEALEGDLSLSDLTRRLHDIGDSTAKYEAVELCFDVMSADGIADDEELRVIRKISEALDLDQDEVEKMRDARILGLDSSSKKEVSIEELLGIDPSWDSTQIRKHLRSEFHKWNNRINTVNEGAERENAQRMLDLIAKARKKYV